MGYDSLSEKFVRLGDSRLFCPFLIALYIRLRPKNDQRRTWAYCIAMKYSHPAHGPAKTIPGQYTNIMDVFQQIKIDC